MTHIRTGIGGWNFDEWRETFYPKEVKKKDELDYASRALKTIEINSTYYRGQKPETFAKWRDATPEGFVFAVKGNRFVTIKKALAEAGESMEKFFATGVTELGDRLGPLLWQFAPTKKFDEADFDAFLSMLPRKRDDIEFRHAVEVRHDSFCVPEFVALAKKHNVAIVYALHPTYPAIADVSTDFVYARLQTGSDEIETCYGNNELGAWARRLHTWHDGGFPDDLPLISPDGATNATKRDVFTFLISSGKSRAPAGAMALQKMVDQQ